MSAFASVGGWILLLYLIVHGISAGLRVGVGYAADGWWSNACLGLFHAMYPSRIDISICIVFHRRFASSLSTSVF